MPVLGYRPFRRELYIRSRSQTRYPISDRQSLAAWERVIAGSNQAATLLDVRSVARWASAAWYVLAEFGIELSALSAHDRSSDFGAFLSWTYEYREMLDRRGWTDSAGIESEIADRSELNPVGAALLGFDEPTSSQDGFFRRLSEDGWPLIRHRWLPGFHDPKQYGADNPDHELHTALRWATRRLEETPSERIAVVIGDLDAHRRYIESRLLDDPTVPVGFATANRAAALPALAAATNALELISAAGSFTSLSQWLRSPYFHGLDDGEHLLAAQFERDIRGTIWSQTPFLHAFEKSGLGPRLKADVPELHRRLRRAIQALRIDSGNRKLPAAWGGAFHAALRHLGWCRGLTSPEDDELRAWEASLGEFASLTPITGPLTHADALSLLRDSVTSQSATAERLPVSGLHLFDDLQDVGPGYAAVWVTGCSEGFSAIRSRTNPLLPSWLGKRYQLPWATPQDALMRSTRMIERIAQGSPEVVFSWPLQDQSGDQRASVLIENFAFAPKGSFGQDAHRPRESNRISKQAFENLDDRPGELDPVSLKGGVSLLNAQSRCPLRAYLEYRLQAVPLEPIPFGLSPKLRGILIHKAAEFLLPAGTRSADIVGLDRDSRLAICETATKRAIRRTLGPLYGSLQLVSQIERRRLQEVLLRLLEQESARSPFEIVATETRQQIPIRGATIGARFDRLDRFDDGTLALVDYKTGRQASAAGWFKERPSDLQLPLYAIHAQDGLSAATLCIVDANRAVYRGYWNPAGRFPGVPIKLPDGLSWQAQIDEWRDAILSLIEEFLAGDIRIFLNASETVVGAFAPLSRIHETASR